MTRQEAIDHILSLEFSVRAEFCVGQKEMDESEAETREALRALGVTDDEMTS